MIDGVFDTSPDGIRKLITEGESEFVEFKRTLPPDAVIAAALTAFANRSGGILLVGVNQPSQAIGLLARDAARAVGRLVKIASNLLAVPSEVGVTDFAPRQVVHVTIGKVPPHVAPAATSRGEVYVRRGSLNIKVGRRGKRVPAAKTRAKRVVVFVAISFREEEVPALVDYFRAMERAADRTTLPIRLTRIDLEEGDFEISQEVMNKIDEVDLVIADFTLTPPNVYFELGYARGRGKRVIQTARDDTTLEFDIRNWRTIFYRNATELEERLIPALAEAYREVTRAG